MFLAIIAAAIALPAAIAGDFDGDGRPDTAVFVADGGAVRLEARLSSRPGVVWPVPDAAGNAGNLYLETLPPGRYPPICRTERAQKCPSAVVIATDAIGFGTPEASMAVAWWTGKAFQTLWTAD